MKIKYAKDELEELRVFAKDLSYYLEQEGMTLKEFIEPYNNKNLMISNKQTLQKWYDLYRKSNVSLLYHPLYSLLQEVRIKNKKLYLELASMFWSSCSEDLKIFKLKEEDKINIILKRLESYDTNTIVDALETHDIQINEALFLRILKGKCSKYSPPCCLNSRATSLQTRKIVQTILKTCECWFISLDKEYWNLLTDGEIAILMTSSDGKLRNIARKYYSRKNISNLSHKSKEELIDIIKQLQKIEEDN